jgi:hypothetical protein
VVPFQDLVLENKGEGKERASTYKLSTSIANNYYYVFPCLSRKRMRLVKGFTRTNTWKILIHKR